MILKALVAATLMVLPGVALCGGLDADYSAPAKTGLIDQGTPLERTFLPAYASPALQDDKAPKEEPKKKSSSKKKSSKKKKSPAIKVAGSVVFQTIYDDNILRFSDGFIEEFRRNEPPEKYHVETYDDLILSPRLFVNFTAKPFAKKNTKLYLGVITWQYARNPEKTNDLWSVRLRQYVWGKDWLQFGYSYSPPSYIRHLSDRETYSEFRSTTPLQWRPFMSVRHGMGLRYYHRFSKTLSGEIEGGRVMRFYNRPFMENDNWEWNGFATLSWNPHKRWRIFGKYMYSNSDARALDTTEETVETSDNGDGSYERDLYETKIRFRPKGGVWYFKEFEVKGQYQLYYFTGTKPAYEDPLHTGRKDDVKVFESYITTKKLFKNVQFKWGYRYAIRESSLPGTFEGEAAEDKDYKNNRTWIEARYSF